MQHAKKLVLLDPKFLEQLQADREYKQIQKPADALAKTSLSLDIGRILRDDTTPEDKKVKLYLDALRRYTNVRSAIPLEADIAPPPPPPDIRRIPRNVVTTTVMCKVIKSQLLRQRRAEAQLIITVVLHLCFIRPQRKRNSSVNQNFA